MVLIVATLDGQLWVLVTKKIKYFHLGCFPLASSILQMHKCILFSPLDYKVNRIHKILNSNGYQRVVINQSFSDTTVLVCAYVYVIGLAS